MLCNRLQLTTSNTDGILSNLTFRFGKQRMLPKGLDKGGTKEEGVEFSSWFQVLLYAQGYQNAYSFSDCLHYISQI